MSALNPIPKELIGTSKQGPSNSLIYFGAFEKGSGASPATSIGAQLGAFAWMKRQMGEKMSPSPSAHKPYALITASLTANSLFLFKYSFHPSSCTRLMNGADASMYH